MIVINNQLTAWMWGNGNSGHLGNNSVLDRSSPVSVVGGHSFKQVATNGGAGYGLKENGEVWAWGDNPNGALGDNSTIDKSSPVSVVGNHLFVKIAAGRANQCFGLKANGECWGWGRATGGSLGDNSTSSRSSPVSVVGNHAFVDIAVGNDQKLALKANGECWAWGAGSQGRLGDGTTQTKSSPVSVLGGFVFTKVATYGTTSYGLRDNGEVWSWGNNSVGQLGKNAPAGGSGDSSPVSVAGNHTFTDIASANSNAYALKADGTCWSWGGGFAGALGDNTTINKSSPVSVVGAHNFIQIGAVTSNGYGLKLNGECWAWGTGSEGFCGNNSIANRSSPVSVVGAFNFKAFPRYEFLGVTQQLSPEGITITDSVVPSSEVAQAMEALSILDSVIADGLNKRADKGTRVIAYNPVVYVTDTDPAEIVSINITDPENPIHDGFNLVGAKFAQDVVRNATTGFLYVACADGIVVKVDETDFNIQTLIDLSDADEMEVIEILEAYDITYISTSSETGEMYAIDGRTEVLGDLRLDVIAQLTQFGDLQFDAIQAGNMDSDLQVLALVTTGFGDMDFKCLSTPVSNLIPIKQTDFDVKIDGVSLVSTDLLLDSISITHNIDQQSTAQFTLCRKHDDLNKNLEGSTITITGQNAVVITIQGTTEFTGTISTIDAIYGENEENVVITAIGAEKTSSFNNVLLSLPSLDKPLGLYEILLQSPQIYNPVLDPLDENPPRFSGIKVQLGQKTQQSYSRYTIFDSFGSIAEDIQDGTFVPRQNWTYFWSPTVRKFGDFKLGEVKAITFLYIGTSLSPVSEDLWSLDNAKHRRQRRRDDIITELGEYTVGVAPFKEISTRNGIFIPKFHWVDRNDGLYSIQEAGFNFEDYAKQIADLEYQKLLNINGTIFPETSASISLTVDGYLYFGITLLSRLNIDNTTSGGIYKNSNGFPISTKSITIDSSTLQVSIQADNLKSNQELETINGMFPDETDEEFNTEAKEIFIAQKSDMKTGLSVQ